MFKNIDSNKIFPLSVVFVTLPFVVNLGFAIKIVLDELTKKDTEENSLRKWLKKTKTKVTLSISSFNQLEEEKSRLIKLNVNKIAFVIIILLEDRKRTR